MELRDMSFDKVLTYQQ